MFQINDIVLYNKTDICRVQEIRKIPFLGQGCADYYVLKPVYEDSSANSTLYVPITADESRIRAAFTVDELRAMLDDHSLTVQWFDAALIRKKEYTGILNRNHPGELIALIRTLARQRAQVLRSGRKFSESDEKYLSGAEHKLFPLFKYILNIEWEDFLELITGEPAARKYELTELK